jgi:hypothetical protein
MNAWQTVRFSLVRRILAAPEIAGVFPPPRRQLSVRLDSMKAARSFISSSVGGAGLVFFVFFTNRLLFSDGLRE